MTEQTQDQQTSMMDVFRSTWDTYQLFGQLREQAPVMHVPELNAWILSRYEDIAQIVNDPANFGSMPADLTGEVPAELAEALPHGYAPWQPALVNTDPPEHTRIRRLAQKPLTPKAIAGKEDEVVGVANRLLDPIVGSGRADLAEVYATPMPVQVLGHILGVPSADHQIFREWTLGIVELFIPTISQERRVELAREQVDFNEYILNAIAERRRSPGDDLISGLIIAQEQNEKSLTDREILGVVGQLIIAGFETSAGGISYTLYTLAQDPELQDRVREDLSLVPKVVEESLRRLTPARGIVRSVKKDVEFHGQVIPAGANIFALVQSANNDPEQFGCPARFDIDRSPQEMRKSLHFGAGNHTCIGISVARLDMRVAVETALKRLPNLRVVPDQDIRVQEGMIFHRPERLEFEWDV